ncbi:MAG: sigma-70 family RNA polymerase sigma factor [Actinomycetota bacterium]|nr:sigma-70 family RNA polymerase sigma factor [Actinomycetota bacterium]
MILGWRRYYEPWLVLKAGRHVADAVVSSVELRLFRLLRRKQQFDSPWRSVVWSMVRNELASERRRLARRSEHETAVGEVFARDSGAEEPSHPLLEEAVESPEHDVARLRRALVKLSSDDQRLLELLFDQELDRTRAATRLGIKPGTLSVRKHRALARLRAAWDEAEGV